MTDPKRIRMLRQVERDAPSKAGLFRKLYAPGGRVSPRHAIKCQCLQCCWMSKAEIRHCTDTACPLWAFRPYQTPSRAKKVAHQPSEAILTPFGRSYSDQTTLETTDCQNAIEDSHPPQEAESCTLNPPRGAL